MYMTLVHAQGAVPAAAEAALLFTSVPASLHSRHQVPSALLQYWAQPGRALLPFAFALGSSYAKTPVFAHSPAASSVVPACVLVVLVPGLV